MSTSPIRVDRPTPARLLLSAAGALLFACAQTPADAEEAPTSSDEDGVVELEQPLHKYTLSLGEGHVVSYRAYADGALLVGESARREADLVLTKSATASSGPVALFRALYPQRAVPDALAQLQAFLHQAAPLRGTDDVAASLGSGASHADATVPFAKTAEDGQSFHDAFGCFFGGDDVYNACVLNSGGEAWSQASSRWAVYKVAPYREALRFTTKIDGAPRLSRPIGEGGFWVQIQAGPPRAQGSRTFPEVVGHRIEITSPGGYHFSARFHNYQTYDLNCAESWSYDRSFEPVKGGAAGPYCESHYGKL